MPRYFEIRTHRKLKEINDYYGNSIWNFMGFKFYDRMPTGYNMYEASDETNVPAPIENRASSLLDLDLYLNNNSKSEIDKLLKEIKTIAHSRMQEYEGLFPIYKEQKLNSEETEKLKRK